MLQDRILKFFAEEAILEKSIERRGANVQTGSTLARMLNPMYYPQHVHDYFQEIVMTAIGRIVKQEEVGVDGHLGAAFMQFRGLVEELEEELGSNMRTSFS